MNRKDADEKRWTRETWRSLNEDYSWGEFSLSSFFLSFSTRRVLRGASGDCVCVSFSALFRSNCPALYVKFLPYMRVRALLFTCRPDVQ